MKATATNYYVREIYGSASHLIDAREEIQRAEYDGLNRKFVEVDLSEFLEEVAADTKVCCIRTKSNKYVEIDKSNIDKFNL